MRFLSTLKSLMGAATVTVLAVSLAGITPAVAKVVFSDSLVVYDPTGKIFASASQVENGENSTTFVFNGLQSVPIDLNQLGHTTVLIEPSTGLWSDVFGICRGC